MRSAHASFGGDPSNPRASTPLAPDFVARITLIERDPPIWRELLVPGTASFLAVLVLRFIRTMLGRAARERAGRHGFSPSP